MRRTIAALALALMPATAVAQPAPDIEKFQNLTATIASDPTVAGQWIVLLPVIARQCGMVVDHERTALMVNRFAHPEAVDEAADYFASGPASSLKADWDVIAKSDQDAACRLADSLWGENGTLFPGILRDVAKDSERML